MQVNSSQQYHQATSGLVAPQLTHGTGNQANGHNSDNVSPQNEVIDLTRQSGFFTQDDDF